MALVTMTCGCEVILPEPTGPRGRLIQTKCPRHGNLVETFHTVRVSVPSPIQTAAVHALVARDEAPSPAEQVVSSRYVWKHQ